MSTCPTSSLTMRYCSDTTAESGGPISPFAASAFTSPPGYGVPDLSSPGMDLDMLDLGRPCSETVTPGVPFRSSLISI